MSPRERARRFVDGELDPLERAAVLADAEKDPALARELEIARSAIAALQSLEVPEPPPDLVNRAVLRAVQRRAAAPKRWSLPRLRFSLTGVAAIAASAMLGGVWIAKNERGEPAARSEHAESAERTEVGEALVRLVLPAHGARTVAVAGDFNEWRTDDVLLEDPEGDGVFSGTLRLRPGSYAYMFVIDGERWVTDPYAANHRDDGFGHRNAVIRID
ncbi:MAG TPA: hypothetical protein VIL20_02825 [Sandaracinaceae bacterium]